ncbi:VOC family protein [Pseudonocardia benzenivorans]|uniref:Glyoxalase/bleomycin resistance protein/dioxygenase n=2 Tax=Pseudonocardia TaxID=1847 RepID=F4CPS5_PSEUX|nr:VOC family protein [Pseudonocardia dioxanivorans]AEA26108.1 Glyoxalase/bleomycin resistance protein/dioxygenase [Pseudonocardia dioxanivorans CB1190]GJF04146.1 glyoxalase [Pseudonocardia sp. D17]
MATHEGQWKAGTPCWVDLNVPDVPTATAFYSAVLGWSFVDTGAEFGNYQIAQVDGRAAAGIGPIMQEGQPSFWTLYLASDDADATAKLVTDNGGSLIAGPMDIPGSGRMVIATDTAGAVFGVWQTLGMNGAEVVNEPGGLVWEDARLTDPETARAFYAAVFGYTYDAVDGAPEDYTTFALDGEIKGGMGGLMGAPDGTPSHWIAYFGAADVDAAVAQVQANGGSVMMAPQNTPFGRMGIVADPFGAPFCLHGEVTG